MQTNCLVGDTVFQRGVVRGVMVPTRLSARGTVVPTRLPVGDGLAVLTRYPLGSTVLPTRCTMGCGILVPAECLINGGSEVPAGVSKSHSR